MDDIVIDILFSALFVLAPFAALSLLTYAGVSLRKFSIPSLFLIFYLVYDYIGILPLYFKLDSYSVALGVVDKTIILKMFLFSMCGLIVIIAGFVYAHRVLGLNSNSVRNRVLVGPRTTQRIFIFCLFVLCILVLLDYIRQLDAVAIFKALGGDIVGAAKARSNMGNAFEGKYWRYQIFFHDLLGYCTVFFFADYLIGRRYSSIFIFGVCFLSAVFTSTMAIEKGPLINLLIMLYLTYVIYKGGRYWQSVAKYAVVVIACLLSVFYVVFMGTKNVTDALMLVLTRIVTGQITPAYFYLYLFPEHIDYLLGASFPNPGGLLPFQNYPLTVEIASYMSPITFLKGIVGSAPTVFWAEMYANFGPSGVIFSSFLVGVGVFTVAHIVSKIPLSTPILVATVLLSMHYSALAGTSLSSYFFDTKLLIIAATTFMVLSVGRSSQNHPESSVRWGVDMR